MVVGPGEQPGKYMEDSVLERDGSLQGMGVRPVRCPSKMPVPEDGWWSKGRHNKQFSRGHGSF